MLTKSVQTSTPDAATDLNTGQSIQILAPLGNAERERERRRALLRDASAPSPKYLEGAEYGAAFLRAATSSEPVQAIRACTQFFWTLLTAAEIEYSRSLLSFHERLIAKEEDITGAKLDDGGFRALCLLNRATFSREFAQNTLLYIHDCCVRGIKAGLAPSQAIGLVPLSGIYPATPSTDVLRSQSWMFQSAAEELGLPMLDEHFPLLTRLREDLSSKLREPGVRRELIRSVHANFLDRMQPTEFEFLLGLPRPDHSAYMMGYFDVRTIFSDFEQIRAFINRAGLSASDLVYDLGCGDGRVVLYGAAVSPARFRGVEIVADRLKPARAFIAECGLSNAELIAADVGDVDFSDGTKFFLYASTVGDGFKGALKRLDIMRQEKKVSVFDSL